MCFGSSSTPGPPPPATPGIVNVDKVAPDPTQAYKYRGEPTGENTSGRTGGTLLLEAAQKKAAMQDLGG